MSCWATPGTSHFDIWADGVTEAKEGKTIFEEIMAEKFSSLKYKIQNINIKVKRICH